MIEPLDFSKYEVPEFPHFFTENKEEAIVKWHQINDSVTEAFKEDLEDYLMNYLAIELTILKLKSLAALPQNKKP